MADSGPSATGGFQFSAGDDSLNIEFDARIHQNGSTQGQIKLSGNVNVPDQDVDGEGTSSGASAVSLSIKVDVDCLSVNGNGAVMSGKIVDSNVASYIGSRALLAVVDKGEGKNAERDQFMWGLYGNNAATWVATDAELEFDPGVGLTWLATDFERDDDVGIPSNPSTTIDCSSFPVVAYAFQELPQGGGNIQVRP